MFVCVAQALILLNYCVTKYECVWSTQVHVFRAQQQDWAVNTRDRPIHRRADPSAPILLPIHRPILVLKGIGMYRHRPIHLQ